MPKPFGNIIDLRLQVHSSPTQFASENSNHRTTFGILHNPGRRASRQSNHLIADLEELH